MHVLTPIILLIATGTLALLSPNAVAQKEQASRSVPEAFTGLNYQKSTVSKNAMVAAANPHAVSAGVKMLELGGNAIDAAIATQLVLTLVEPQSSGIGGGAFLLWYDAKTKHVTSYDGRETAPSKATSDLFMENGKPVKWIDAVIGGRSVGVPGLLHMLNRVHQIHGKLPWSQLFQPAIKLAEDGFRVSPRLAKLVAMKMNPGLEKMSPAREYFYPNGKAIQAGALLTNKEYAKTLHAIADGGIAVFYKGVLAAKIVNAVNNSAIAPGLLSTADMANYESKVRDVVCADYLEQDNKFEVCSMGAPSSGGITVLQILAMLETLDFSDLKLDHLQTLHLYAQAARLAYADRDKYLADPDFVYVPTNELLNKRYIQQRAALIDKNKDMGYAKAGQLSTEQFALNESIAQPNTTHISIVDQFGNALSMTSSIEMGFGSTVMVGGFLLNNQLTDFSLVPGKNGQLIANRVEANKRPRSSMTPVIVLNNKEVYSVLGSPGGSRIINYVGYALLGLLEFNMDIEELVNGPRFSNRNGYTAIEKGTELVKHKAALESLGHQVKIMNMTSGIHAIVKTQSGWKGVADPRREGTAKGF